MIVELEQAVIQDVLALISAPTLTIQASQALRVAQLQAVLSNLQPSKALDDERHAHANTAQERESARDIAVRLEQELAAAQSDYSVMLARWKEVSDELEHEKRRAKTAELELEAARANVRTLIDKAERAADEVAESHARGIYPPVEVRN